MFAFVAIYSTVQIKTTIYITLASCAALAYEPIG